MPDSCVLGQPHEGNLVADVLLKSSRLRNAMVGLGLAKQIFNDISLECIDKKMCGVLLK